ncbi:MAG: DUF2490 domain-containing protein [Erythrobacter sp.]|jgi:hypothetical protein|nr:DUF2490 domain-containing protein [Erythrobacter sp.]
MKLSTPRLAPIALVLAATHSPVFAQRADEDTQLWVYLVAEAQLDEKTDLTVDASARWREERRGDEQRTLRFTLLREVAGGTQLGGGAGIFEAEGGATELRVHQQLGLETGRWSARTRIEQRFFDGADRMELRFRQRVRYTQPLTTTFELEVDGEYLGLAQTRDRIRNLARDQWRLRAILNADLSERLTLGAGYMMIYTPRDGGGDAINHVPQGYVTYRF